MSKKSNSTLYYNTDVIAESPFNDLAHQLVAAGRTHITPGQTNWTEVAKFVHREFLEKRSLAQDLSSHDVVYSTLIRLPIGASNILNHLVLSGEVGHDWESVVQFLLVSALQDYRGHGQSFGN